MVSEWVVSATTNGSEFSVTGFVVFYLLDTFVPSRLFPSSAFLLLSCRHFTQILLFIVVAIGCILDIKKLTIDVEIENFIELFNY